MSTLQGDGPCAECGATENIVWFTDNTVWNNAVRGYGPDWPLATARWGGDPILCIPCFVAVCEDYGYRPQRWRLTPEWPVVTAEPESAVDVAVPELAEETMA